jgi:NitT/TauT family transport system permease protein
MREVTHRRLRILSVLFAISAWQVIGWSGLFPKHLLPWPTSVVRSLIDLLASGELALHILTSLLRVVAGFLLAGAIAVPLGILTGWSKVAESLTEPILEILRPIPPIAWIPIAMLWFGLGFKPAVFLIFVGAFFPILLNTVAGVKGTPRVLVEAVRTLGASDRDILVKVIAPSSIPSIIAGLRVGLGVGWMCLVAAEMTGSSSGLGYMIIYYSGILETSNVMVGMLAIGAVGYLMSYVIAKIERRLLRWRE